MLHLLEIVGLDALIGFALLFGVMCVAAGLRFDDVRDVVLNRVYRSFTFEGERVPGLHPGPLARLAIRLLSDPGDTRLDAVPDVRARSPRLRAPSLSRTR